MTRLILPPRRWLVLILTGVLVALSTGIAAAHRDRPGRAIRAGAVQVRRGPSTVAAHPMAIDPMSYDYGHTLATLSGPQLETTFMGGMIGHHEAAIAMARLELRRGTNRQIRRMARSIITSQRREVKEMTAWLKTWYGLTPEQAVDHAPQPASTQIRAMEAMMGQDMIAPLQATAAGPGFDVKFVGMMVAHHQMALLETPPEQDSGIHVELVHTANNIALSQEQEIIRMLAWLHSHR